MTKAIGSQIFGLHYSAGTYTLDVGAIAIDDGGYHAEALAVHGLVVDEVLFPDLTG